MCALLFLLVVLSMPSQPGNSLHMIMECFNNFRVIPDSMPPFTDDWKRLANNTMAFHVIRG